MSTASAHPAAPRRILWSRLLTHAGDQAWDFAVPLALVGVLPKSLSAVAAYYLAVRFLHMTLVTHVSSLIDHWDRLRAIRTGILAQVAGVVLATASVTALARDPGAFVWFPVVVLAGLCGSLGATMMQIAVAQDWLPTVVDAADLGRVNSRLRQIDLATELTVPALTGLILAFRTAATPLLGFWLVALFNAVSFGPEYLLLRAVYRAERRLAERPPEVHAPARRSIPQTFAAGWRDFKAQPAMASMLSYTLLWLTVLSPHGVLLTAWLKESWQLPETQIGLFRGLGAVFGLLGTFLFPLVLKWRPLVSTARSFIIFQALSLVLAGVAFAAGREAAWIFALGVLLSRVGLYGFSLGEVEIRQRAVPAAVRGRVNGVASAINSLAALVIYGAGALLPKAEDFSWLVYGSVGCVAAGALLFTWWASRTSLPEARE